MTYTEQVSTGNGDTAFSTTQTCNTAYPKEWNRQSGLCSLPEAISMSPRYTCISNVASAPVAIDFASSVAEFASYTPSSCNNGALTLDGKEIARSANTCITTQTSGNGDDMTTTTVDSTLYKNLSFHTIPSLYKHISPTDEEIVAAKVNTVTPSLPVDMVRYVEFLTPKGNIARIHYPNFFDISATDIPSARAWIRETSRLDWQSIIDRENVTVLTKQEIQANSYLSA